MAGPWEKYATPDAQTSSTPEPAQTAAPAGPWTKYSADTQDSSTAPATQAATGKGLSIDSKDAYQFGQGAASGLLTVPDAALDLGLSALFGPQMTNPVTRNTPWSPRRMIASAAYGISDALGMGDEMRSVLEPDASFALDRKAQERGYVAPRPADSEGERPRFFYNLGRNVGASAPLAPVAGATPILLGAAGATMGGETMHGLFPDSPVAEQIGSAVGGLAAGVGEVAPGATARAAGGFVRPLTQSGREAVVGDVLRRANQGSTTLPVEAAPIPEMPRSLGQATNAPGVLALEKQVAQDGPENQAAFLTLKSNANKTILDRLRSLASGQTLEHANANVRTALDEAYAASNRREAQLWDGIDPNGQVRVPPELVGDTIANYEASLSPADQGAIPAWVKPVVEKLQVRGDQTSLSDVIAFDKRLGRDIRGTTEPQERFWLTGLQRALRDRLGDQDLFAQIDPKAQARWQEARAFTAQQKEIFQGSPLMRRAMGQSGAAPAIPESSLLSNFVKQNGGSAEAIDQFLRAAGKDQRATTAARDYLVDLLTNASNKAELDQSGKPMMNDVRMRDVMGKYQQPMRRVFSESELSLMDALAKATEVMNRTTRAGYRGGSDTFSKLSGSRFIDRILEKTLMSENAPAGAGVAGYAVGGPLGAGTGYLGAMAGRARYLHAQEQVNALLRQALLNPELAQTLVAKANPKTLEVVSPAVRHFIEQGMQGALPSIAQTVTSAGQHAQPVTAGDNKKRQASAAPAATPAAAPAKPTFRGPPIGTVVDGYRRIYGPGDVNNPNDQRNWEPVS